ncbi:bifunctional metallophosphatase/5'-nucleotidase [Fluviicola chungangensis]|uniref:Bifunctional metallophosphatase/5'-nucleotidase n=1 Tax=Fluviicola chungangensis TaxID=2597671 RepID=A0A556MRD2_9FLAO|nr:metallophosphatase [Fluviicola chungangensis]TSJ42467.1 bifunctional metallophosphatase/5'-nucleotidase [Fluviicola chungangensis]
MERRLFLQQTGVAAGAAMVAPSLMSAKQKQNKLVILHTNDTHSNIDPFPVNHPKFPNMGGVSRRASLIQSIRDQEEHVLLLDAGDIFQGTPYFNKFKGVLEMKTMAAMKYDIVTLGNHDFDIGMEAYKSALSHASFQVVNANYELASTPLSEVVKPYTIIKKAGLKIGIFGLGVNLQGLVPVENWKGLTYLDPVSAAQKQADTLRKEGCDVVICLSHLGYEYNTDQVSDKVLAASTAGIDVIIGGHTHTFLEDLQEFKNKEGKSVFVNQVGYGGLKLGRIDIERCMDSGKFTIASTNRLLDDYIA